MKNRQTDNELEESERLRIYQMSNAKASENIAHFLELNSEGKFELAANVNISKEMTFDNDINADLAYLELTVNKENVENIVVFVNFTKLYFYETCKAVKNKEIENQYAYSTNKKLKSKESSKKILTINKRLIGAKFDTIELSLPNVNKSNLKDLIELLQTIKLCLK